MHLSDDMLDIAEDIVKTPLGTEGIAKQVLSDATASEV